MSKMENVMLCLTYALGRIPALSEIHRAKSELLNVDPKSVRMVIKSSEFLFSFMAEREIALFKEQVCACMLSAVNYRITAAITERDSWGYAICPRCRAALDRDYQSFCDHCGQHLKWNGWGSIKIRKSQVRF